MLILFPYRTCEVIKSQSNCSTHCQTWSKPLPHDTYAYTWGLPGKGRRFFSLVMVEKTNLTICHGVMGTTQAENDQRYNQVDARDSSWYRASLCITGLSHSSHLLKLWPECKSQLVLNKRASKLDRGLKFKIPTINYSYYYTILSTAEFFPCLYRTIFQI